MRFNAMSGIKISTTNQDKSGAFEGYIKVTVVIHIPPRYAISVISGIIKPHFGELNGALGTDGSSREAEREEEQG